jgi:transposase-like protein
MKKMLDERRLFNFNRYMNKLDNAKRSKILCMLVEGSSMRSVSRVCDVSINAIAKHLSGAGKACAGFHAENVKAKRIQCD